MEENKLINKGGRPKGSKDKQKRRVKKFLSVEEERYIKNNWLDFSIKHFAKKFNVSNGTIINASKVLKLEKKISIAHKLLKCQDINLLKDKCGVYGIMTYDYKIYIGSSANIKNRIVTHLNKLNNNKHENKSLQGSWNTKGWYGVLEECDEQKLIERENYYIKYTANIHNTFIFNEYSKEDIDFLKCKILTKININNECWEYTGRIGKSGYGEICINKSRQKGTAHRIMYFSDHPNENQNKIIRHKCNNKKCCNPDHLISGSYRDNGLDNKRDEMERFEKRFVETNYDSIILQEEFNMTYEYLYNRIKHLKLFSKYPELKRRKNGKYVNGQMSVGDLL